MCICLLFKRILSIIKCLENIWILVRFKLFCFPPHVCLQWEARVTQYERDFDRIGMTVRKEVLRFEVCVCINNGYENFSCFIILLQLWIKVE